jgi:hypothetical protein
MKTDAPLAIDLYCGLGGWAEGFLSAGYRVVGFDIEIHDYGTGRYPGQLVLQDVLTLHGSQFKNAAVIVASPPCTEPSYRAMPWKRAKALNAIGPPETFLKLFHACFRIQREACEAAGRHIPLIVENVVGAQAWVGRAAWHFGSYYLWGDLPALMPIPSGRMKCNPDGTSHPPGSWFAIADSKNRGAKSQGQNWSRFNQTGEVSPHWRMEASKTVDHLHLRDGETHTRHLTNPAEHVKVGGDWFSDPNSTCRRHGSKSKARKRASAEIAKIPFPLARHIAAAYFPR